MANPNLVLKDACAVALSAFSELQGMVETAKRLNGKNNDANDKALSVMKPVESALNVALGRAPEAAPAVASEAAKVASASNAPVDSQGPSFS